MKNKNEDPKGVRSVHSDYNGSNLTSSVNRRSIHEDRNPLIGQKIRNQLRKNVKGKQEIGIESIENLGKEVLENKEYRLGT